MGQPIYQQIIETLKHDIESMEPNAPIQSERELAQRFEASRMTVRKAVRKLVEDGYLYRDGNLGTFVADQKLHKNVKNQNIQRLFSERSDYHIIYFDVKNDNVHVNEKLEIDGQDQYIRIVRLNQLEKKAESIDEIYIVRKFVDHKEMSNIQNILTFSGNLEKGSMKQEFTPINVPINYANLLKLDINTPIIRIESTVYTKSGRVYAYICTYKNPNNSKIELVF